MIRLVAAAAVLLSPITARAAVFLPLAPVPDRSAFMAGCTAGRSAVTCLCMAQILERSGEGQFVLERDTVNRDRGGDAAMTALMARHEVPPQPSKKLTKAAKESAKEALAACR